jgi:hypothetical protein
MNCFAARIFLLLAVVANLPVNAQQNNHSHFFNDGNPHTQEWGTVLSLDGRWQVAEGNLQQIPQYFPSAVSVPGLIKNASPAFVAVGADTNLREAFWYKTTFKTPGKQHEVARLKIFKSLFGAKVFINGKLAGESAESFIPLYFNLSPYLKKTGQTNELIIRVAAHIKYLPDTVVTGGDPERHAYVPGLYDHVQVIFSANSFVQHTQVVPLLQNNSILAEVDFTAINISKTTMKLQATVYEYASGKKAGSVSLLSNAIKKNQHNKKEFEIKISNPKLWTPSSPNLYVLELTDGTYKYRTRFGMRHFMVDSNYTNKALLNHQQIFLRGTNFSVHRFFEDTLSKQLPWDTAWVRKLFRTYTAMGMNAVRVCIGPAPELWYEIADEEGMMVMDEYAIWYAYQPDVGSVAEQAADKYKKWGIWPKNLHTKQLVKEYTAWMKERWNHACVIVWDAQNETWAKQTGEALMAVRKLDLSNRVWDNGWSPPMQKGDIREAHPYFESWTKGTEMMTANGIPKKPFSLPDLETADKLPSTFYLPYQYKYGLPAPDWYWQQPCIINEYSCLWLQRDGSACVLAKHYYDAVLGDTATVNERRELYARYLAAVTEYWRSVRSCFGVLYPFGIASSIEGGVTSDNFIDIPNLQFDEYYQKYVPDAFAEVGLCLELWKNEFEIKPWSGTQAEFAISVINDSEKHINGSVQIKVIKKDTVISTTTYSFTAKPVELVKRYVKIDLPDAEGEYEVVGELLYYNKKTCSYRTIKMLKATSNYLLQ